MKMPRHLEIKQLSNSIIFFNIVSILCFGVSAYFSISLFLESGTTGLKQSVNVVSAIALEFSKVGFFLFCGYVSATKKDIPGKPLLWALCAVLFAGSMFATASYFFNSTSEKSTTATKTDDQYQSMKSEIAGIDAQIKELQDTASKQRSIKHITQSKATLDRVDRLREERKAVSGRIGGYTVTDSSEKHFEQLAKFLGSNPQDVKAGVFLALSVVLECCGIGAGFWSMHARSQKHELDFSPDEPTRYQAGQDPAEPFRRREIVKEDARPDTGFYPEPSPAMAKRNIGYLDGKKFTDSDLMRNQQQDRVLMKNETSAEISGKGETLESQQRHIVEPILKQKNDPLYSTVQYSTEDDEESDDPTKDDYIRYVKIGFKNMRQSGYWQSRRNLSEEAGLSQREGDVIHSDLKRRGLVEVRDKKTWPKLTEPEMIERLSAIA